MRRAFTTSIITHIPPRLTANPLPPTVPPTSVLATRFRSSKARARMVSASSSVPSFRDLRPPMNTGMTNLDKDKFKVTVPVVTISVPANDVGGLRKHDKLRDYFVDTSKVKSIVEDPEDPSRRRMLMRVSELDQLPEETRQAIEEIGAKVGKSEVVLGWDHWNANEILHSILPIIDDEIPSSFTQTGHIAHVNLNEEWLPYKSIIGQVMVEKLAGCRTVVNKVGSIHAQFRYFDMEVLAGEPNFITSVSESDCTFAFDFSKVYWNSRLHTEHSRLIDQFEPGTVVADAMAGVGPFAVPAAKKGVYVLGNDLNPESVKWMTENQKRNRVEERLRVSCRDAREFIAAAPLEAWRSPFKRSEPMSNKQKGALARQRRKEREAGQTAPAVKSEPAAETPPAPQTISHFVMNLPDSALEFLDAYAGSFTPLLSEEGYDRTTPLPVVHVHCFTRFLDPEEAAEDIHARATERLGYPVSKSMDAYNLHLVRRVAPNKDMYCLSFRLPAEVAYAIKE